MTTGKPAPLDISPATWDELARALRRVGHGHLIKDGGVIDLESLELQRRDVPRGQQLRLALNR